LIGDTMTNTGRWDAIVVGSGLGGLTAAAYLTAAGKRALLLEQYDVVGGCSHAFRRRREWEFKVGVHYLGDRGPEGQIPTMLRGLGLGDRIDFLPMDPARSAAGWSSGMPPSSGVAAPDGIRCWPPSDYRASMHRSPQRPSLMRRG
jgi:hypothetical protein